VAISPRRSSYAHGSKVTLSARPRDGAEFHGWSGDVAGESTSITLTVKGDLQVSARFDWPPRERRVRDSVEGLLLAAGDGGTSSEDLEARIGAVANAYGDYRDALYGGVAKADEAFLEALRGCGEDAKGLANLEQLVLEEVGPWAFMPGRTASLQMLYERDPGLPKCDPVEFARHQRAWRSAVQRELRQLEDADRQTSYRLAPRMLGDELSSSWRPTGHRREAFEQERRVYTTAARLTKDPALKARLEEEARALEELREIDDELLQLVRGESTASAASASGGLPVTPTSATSAAPAAAAPTAGVPSPGFTDASAESSGATGALGRIGAR
jgi:hypothetical protein